MQRNAFACVSNNRPFVLLSTAKIYFRYNHDYSTKVMNGYPVMVFENKNSSFSNEVEAEIKIKIKQINLIIQFCNKAKIFLFFDVKSVYISCTSRKQCENSNKHFSQVSPMC